MAHSRKPQRNQGSGQPAPARFITAEELARMHGFADMRFKATGFSEPEGGKMVGNIMSATTLVLGLVPILWAHGILSKV